MSSLGYVNNPPNGYFKRLRITRPTRLSAIIPSGSPQILTVSGGNDDGVVIDTGAYVTLIQNGTIGGVTPTTHALPNGTHTNQLKLLRHASPSMGTAATTITSNNLQGGNQLLLSLNGLTVDVATMGVHALLKWSGSKWILIDKSPETAVTITTV